MRRTMEYPEFLKNVDDFIFPEHIPEKADIIFVPGNGYPQMAEMAAELYMQGYAPCILPSGKYSIGRDSFQGVIKKADIYCAKYETEWEFLKDVLVKNKVSEKDILKEDRATFTYENAVFSRKVTDQSGIKVKRALLCCKTYHARRCLMYYQLLYPQTQFFVVPVNADGITRDNWRDTREGIEAVTGEVKRIIEQFSLMTEYK